MPGPGGGHGGGGRGGHGGGRGGHGRPPHRPPGGMFGGMGHRRGCMGCGCLPMVISAIAMISLLIYFIL